MPTLHLLTPTDARLLDDVAPDVFDNPVDPALAAEFLADPRHHIAVAIDDDRTVVAFASAIHYLNPDKPARLWVNEVGTAPSHRRRGLAGCHGHSPGVAMPFPLAPPHSHAAWPCHP